MDERQEPAVTPGGAVDGASGEIVLRPRTTRIVGYVIGVAVLVAMTVIAVAIPHLSGIDRVGFVLFGLAVLIFCHREASVAVRARPDALVVRNLGATRRLDWAEILEVSFPAGDPWAHLELADGETLATMAIQRTEAARGIEQARLLARLVRERGEARPEP